MNFALLKEILHKNKHTEIGRKWTFQNISSIDEFHQNVPLTTYEDYRHYIERMVEKGEQNLITNDVITQFSMSSGTTGKAKYIPAISTIPSLDLVTPDPSDSNGIKILHLVNIPQGETFTPGGTPVVSISVRVLKHFLKVSPNRYVVPVEAYNLSPLSAAMYVQMVFALKEPHLTEISSVFVPLVISALMLLKTKWAEMIEDIETGQFSACRLTSISNEKRSALNELLHGPDTARAAALKEIFSQHKRNGFKNLLAYIWPKLKVVKCLCSGNMSCYVPTLKHFCGSSIHVLSYWYGCSEIDIIGIPAKPLEETSLFRLSPNNFYEFIPVEENETCVNQTNILFLNDIEVGKVYEIIVTSRAGFYRYRIGDYLKIIKISKEHGPLFDFSGRKKMILKIGGHTLFEAIMEKVMTEYVSECATSSRIDYTVDIDQQTFTRYRVWLECEECIDQDNVDKFLDDRLCKIDDKYRFDRGNGRIDPLMVVFVKSGAFSKILDYMKSKTLNAETQLKIPRMVFDQKIQDILEETRL